MKPDTRKPGPRPDPKKRKLAMKLLACETPPQEVAEKVGVHHSTVYRLRKSPEYLKYIEKAEKNLEREITDFRRLIIIGQIVSVRKLTEMIEDPNCPDDIRLQCAEALLDRGDFPRTEVRVVNVDYRDLGKFPLVAQPWAESGVPNSGIQS